MKKIVYWQRFVSTEHCIAYKSEIEECLQLIHEGNYKEVSLEKLTGTKNTYSARFSRSGRIIFTIIEEQGEQTVLLLDVLLNHEYDKCVYLNDQYLNKYLANLNSKDLFIYNTEDSSFSKASSFSELDSASASPLFQPQWQAAIKYHHESILLDPSQQELLTCALPAFIEGVAGSGKTCTAFAKLIDEDKKQDSTGRVVYVTLSEHLIHQIQEEFEAETANTSVLALSNFNEDDLKTLKNIFKKENISPRSVSSDFNSTSAAAAAVVDNHFSSSKGIFGVGHDAIENDSIHELALKIESLEFGNFKTTLFNKKEIKDLVIYLEKNVFNSVFCFFDHDDIEVLKEILKKSKEKSSKKLLDKINATTHEELQNVLFSDEDLLSLEKALHSQKELKNKVASIYQSISEKIIKTREILFLTYEQFLEKCISENAKKEFEEVHREFPQLVSIKDFEEWFKRKLKDDKYTLLRDLSIDLIIGEARFKSGFITPRVLNANTQEELERAASEMKEDFLEKYCFITEDSKRQLFDAVLKEYHEHLFSNNLINIELTKLIPGQIADLIIVDESQAFSGAQIYSIKEAVVNCQVMYCYDQYQNLVDGIDHLKWLKQDMRERHVGTTSIVLQKGHRCKQNVTDCANRILELRKKISGKRYAASSQLRLDGVMAGGGVQWLSQDDFRSSGLKTKFDPSSPHWAVVVGDDSLKPQALSEFGTLNIFTEEEIRGLEFKDIILYHPFKNQSFKRIHALLSKSDESAYSQLDDQSRYQFRIALSKLFTGLTRSQNNLLIISPKSSFRSFYQYLLERIENEIVLDVESTESKEVGWFNRAKERMDKKDRDTALNIIQQYCSSITFEEFEKAYLSSKGVTFLEVQTVCVAKRVDLLSVSDSQQAAPLSFSQNKHLITKKAKDIKYEDLFVQENDSEFIHAEMLEKFLAHNIKKDNVWKVFSKNMKDSFKIDLRFLNALTLSPESVNLFFEFIDKLVDTKDLKDLHVKFDAIFENNKQLFQLIFSCLNCMIRTGNAEDFQKKNPSFQDEKKLEELINQSSIICQFFIMLMRKAVKIWKTQKDFKSNKTFIFLLLLKESVFVSQFFDDLDAKRIDIYYLMGQGCQAVWGYQGEAGSSFGSSISELFLKRNDSRISIIRSSLKNILTTDGVIDLKKIESIKKDFGFEVNINVDYEKRNLAIAYLLVKYTDRTPEDSLLEIMQSFADIEGEGLREIIELIKLQPSLAEQLSGKYIWKMNMGQVLQVLNEKCSIQGRKGFWSLPTGLGIPFDNTYFEPWLNIWMLAILKNTQRTNWSIVHALMFDPQFGKLNLMELFLEEIKKSKSFFNHEIVKEHLHEFLMIENKYTEYDDSLVNSFRLKIANLISYNEENDNTRMLALLKTGIEIFDPTIVDDLRIIEVYKFLCPKENLKQNQKLLDFIYKNQDILYRKISKENLTVLGLFILIQDTRFMIQLLDMGIDFLTIREGRQSDLLQVYYSPRIDKMNLADTILELSKDFKEASYFLNLRKSNKEKFDSEFIRFIIENVYIPKKERVVAKIIHFLIKTDICNNFDILGNLLKYDFECFKWFFETMKKYFPHEMISFFIKSESVVPGLTRNRVLLEMEIKKYFQKVIFIEGDEKLESNLSFLMSIVDNLFRVGETISEKWLDIFEIPSDVEYNYWFRAISKINAIQHNLIHPNVFLKFYERYRKYDQPFSFFKFSEHLLRENFLASCFNFSDDSGENFIDKMIEHEDYEFLIDLLIRKGFIETIRRQQNSSLQSNVLRLINKILIKIVENKNSEDFCIDKQDKLIKILLIIDSLSSDRYCAISVTLPLGIRFSLYEAGFSIKNKDSETEEELLTPEEKKSAMPANMIKYLDDLYNLVIEESAKKKAIVIMKRLRATISQRQEKESVAEVLSKITAIKTYEAFMRLIIADQNIRARFLHIFSQSMIGLIGRFPTDSIKIWGDFLNEDKADLWSSLKDVVIREQGEEEWGKLLNHLSILLPATMAGDLVIKFNKIPVVEEYNNNVLNVRNAQPVTMSNSAVGRSVTKKPKK